MNEPESSENEESSVVEETDSSRDDTVITNSELPEDGVSEQQGPGCMPAVIAGAALMGIVGFITCALMTWLIFQKRTELAIRTLEGAYVPQVEQSLLDPVTKQEVLEEIKVVIEDMKEGQYEDWQSAGIMQSLQKLPVIQWGELQALEESIQEAPQELLSETNKTVAINNLQKIKLAVKQGKVFSFDFEDVLEPIRKPSNTSPSGYVIEFPLQDDGMLEAIRRIQLLADRSTITSKEIEVVNISEVVRDQIKSAATADQ